GASRTSASLTFADASFAEFFEVDGPLVDERVAALHRLVGLVVETERGVGELGDTGARLGVDVERLLGKRQRGRALLEQLRTPLLDLGAEILERDHAVDEAHRERVGRPVLTAEIPDLPRLLLADDARQEAGAVARVHAAHARPGLAEDRVVRG